MKHYKILIIISELKCFSKIKSLVHENVVRRDHATEDTDGKHTVLYNYMYNTIT